MDIFHPLFKVRNEKFLQIFFLKYFIIQPNKHPKNLLKSIPNDKFSCHTSLYIYFFEIHRIKEGFSCVKHASSGTLSRLNVLVDSDNHASTIATLGDSDTWGGGLYPHGRMSQIKANKSSKVSSPSICPTRLNAMFLIPCYFI